MHLVEFLLKINWRLFYWSWMWLTYVNIGSNFIWYSYGSSIRYSWRRNRFSNKYRKITYCFVYTRYFSTNIKMKSVRKCSIFNKTCKMFRKNVIAGFFFVVHCSTNIKHVRSLLWATLSVFKHIFDFSWFNFMCVCSTSIQAQNHTLYTLKFNRNKHTKMYINEKLTVTSES